MNLFQWLTVPFLLMLATIDLVLFLRQKRKYRLFRLSVSLLAAILILFPQAASGFARTVGIGRGADLVVYTFILVATAVMFHFYGRQFTLRRDLVQLARREALRSPIAGKGLASNASESPAVDSGEIQENAADE